MIEVGSFADAPEPFMRDPMPGQMPVSGIDYCPFCRMWAEDCACDGE